MPGPTASPSAGHTSTPSAGMRGKPVGPGCSALPSTGKGSPGNAAFDQLPPAALKKLLADRKQLTKLLSYHVVEGGKAPSQLVGAPLKTMQGGRITVKGSGQDYIVSGRAKVVCGDIATKNATIYIIDKVLTPHSK
ncbi:fasciclin domain-containing protein [Streptosporangium vulgare]